MGLFSFVGGLIGGNSAKKAANKASQVQQGAANVQQANLSDALSNTLSAYTPYTSLGASSAQAYADLLGLGGSSGTTTTQMTWDQYLDAHPEIYQQWQQLGKKQKRLYPTPEAYAQQYYNTTGRARGDSLEVTTQTGEDVSAADAQAAAIEGLKTSPLYTSLMDAGNEAILASASATGGLRGGNTVYDLAQYGNQTLSDVIQNQLANYQSGINVGLGATGSTTQARYNTATGQNVAVGNSADARSQAILTAGGINAQNWQNAGSLADSVASAVSGGGSIGSTIKGLF